MSIVAVEDIKKTTKLDRSLMMSYEQSRNDGDNILMQCLYVDKRTKRS